MKYWDSLRAFNASAEFFVDECLFGMPFKFPKIHAINQVPQLLRRKKYLKSGVLGMCHNNSGINNLKLNILPIDSMCIIFLHVQSSPVLLKLFE